MPRKHIDTYPLWTNSNYKKNVWKVHLEQKARRTSWKIRINRGYVYSYDYVSSFPSHLLREEIVKLRAQSREYKWPGSLRYDCKAAQLELWLIAKKYIHPTKYPNIWGFGDYLAHLVAAINKELGQFID